MDQKMLGRAKIALSLIFIISFINLASASSVLCDTTSVDKAWTEGQTPSTESITCVNNGNSQVSVTKIGSHFSSNPSFPFNINAGEQKSFTLSFDSNTAPGSYGGAVSFSDGLSILVDMEVTEGQQDNGGDQSGVIVFPTNQIISVKQGSEKSQSILVSVPSNYGQNINIQSVGLNPSVETIRLGDLSLGVVHPGQSVQIPITFSGIDAQTGTYQTSLNILATDNNGKIDLPSVSLQLQVTAGTSPDGGNLTKPSCSLSSVTMNLNGTYTLSCSGVVANLDVVPEQNDFIEGISAQITSGIYTYNFRPVKFGTTQFKAYFRYLNSPIFAPFIQDISVSSSGLASPGTNLKFLFTPDLSLAKEGEEVIIQLVDNQTGSLVSNPEIYVDATPLTNSTGSSFKFAFLSNVNYSMRGRAPGYQDILQYTSLTSAPMQILINPTVGDSSTVFMINTSIENATLLINGEKVSNPYMGSLPKGNNTLLAVKEGYIDAYLNISVEEALIATPAGEFKKSVKQIITLTRSTKWELQYQASAEDPRETILSGEGTKIEFTPNRSGTYYVISKDSDEDEGRTVSSYEIQGFSLSSLKWYWWAIGAAALMGIVYLYRRNGGSSDVASIGLAPARFG